MKAKISVVTPVYNEADAVIPFLQALEPVLESLTPDYEIVFALDPSRDGTGEVIEREHQRNPRVKLVEFSRRFGQPMATLGGLSQASGDAVVVMDVDLQDPPEVIREMVARWLEGYDVVLASRRKRTGTPLTYRMLTFIGYRLIHWLADDVKIPTNTGDFRLLSRRAVDEVLRLKESHGFLRGMVALVGFRQTAVWFDRPARSHGRGHYNAYWGSLKIALNGFVCFSNGMLRVTTFAGFTTAAGAFFIALLYAWLKFHGQPFPIGNPTIVILILFLGGVQLISVGILGEYIGRIYDEVKRRPRFIVARRIGFAD